MIAATASHAGHFLGGVASLAGSLAIHVLLETRVVETILTWFLCALLVVCISLFAYFYGGWSGLVILYCAVLLASALFIKMNGPRRFKEYADKLKSSRQEKRGAIL